MTDQVIKPAVAGSNGVIGGVRSLRHASAAFFKHQLARLVFVSVLTMVAFIVPILDTLHAASVGSRNVYLIATPVLVGLIIAGYRHPPRGVGDAESDWILSLIIGIGGLGALEFVIRRYPTVAAQWHLQNMQMVVWLIAASIVVFSVRYVARLWTAWLFAFACAPVLPYLLTMAAFGGSDTVAALLAAVVGSIAVCLAGPSCQWRWRLAATAATLTSGAACVLVLADASLSLRVMIAAAVIPVLTTVALNRYGQSKPESPLPAVTASFPHRQVWSYLVLIAAALVVSSLQFPHQALPDPPRASAQWALRMNLRASKQFPFIARFIGPGTTLVRYAIPVEPGKPATVVDVISAANLANMRDFRDVVWYPFAQPTNYHPHAVENRLHVQLRSVYDNADVVTTGSTVNWYAITWAWRVGSGFQRVTVVVNQDPRSSSYPPEPQPITLRNSLIEPAIWIMRQQPDTPPTIEPEVIERAEAVTGQILATGANGD